MYIIEGQITLEDFQNANRLGRKPKGFALVLRILAYAVIVLGILFILSIVFRSPSLGTILPFLVLVGLIVFMFAYVPYRVKKVYEQQKELHYPYTMTVDETGIHTKNQIGEAKRPWNLFVKWREDRNLIILYHSDVMFSMLSKRYLNEESLRFVHEQLKKNNIPEK